MRAHSSWLLAQLTWSQEAGFACRRSRLSASSRSRPIAARAAVLDQAACVGFHGSCQHSCSVPARLSLLSAASCYMARSCGGMRGRTHSPTTCGAATRCGHLPATWMSLKKSLCLWRCGSCCWGCQHCTRQDWCTGGGGVMKGGRRVRLGLHGVFSQCSCKRQMVHQASEQGAVSCSGS